MSEALRLERQQATEELHRRLTTGSRRTVRARRAVAMAVWTASIVVLGSAKRAADFCLALLLLVALSPICLAIALLATGRKLVRTPRAGRFAQPFDEYSFPVEGRGGSILNALHLHRLPALLNILRGEMSFIGPRAVSPGELSPRDRVVR